MQNFFTSPKEMVFSFWRNRNLIVSLVKREVVGRYRGSIMGILWSFFNPLLMLAVYTFVFGVIFKSRWNPLSDSKTEFALVLFIGMIVFNLFAECINRAPGLIISNVNYVKKVVFPLEILPWISLGVALFHAFISLIVWLLAYLVFFGIPHASVLALPLVGLPLLLFTVGLSWFLSSLGVYLRDVAQFIGIVTTVLMFLSPVFYPATALPEEYRSLLFINPMTVAIEFSRDALFWGNAIDWPMLSVCYGVTIVIAWLGFVWFQKTRKGFADVL